jgi:putative oxidoreductase
METLALGEKKRAGSLFHRFDIASLVLRAMIGVVFIAHGAQKLFGAFNGGGLHETANAMAEYGLRPGMFFAVLGGIIEFGGGLLLLVGLLTPVAGVIIICNMIVAIAVSSGRNGFVVPGRLGYEYNLVLIAIAFALTIIGGGRLSLDHGLGVDETITGHLCRLRTKYHR